MSVIIKGMNKPISCGECDISRYVNIETDIGSCPFVGTILDYYTIDPDCPLISIDDLFEELKEKIEE